MRKQGDLDKARHHFYRALQINPANKSAARHLAELERLMPKAVGD
jgi:Tfp pilus assembly protein PilF